MNYKTWLSCLICVGLLHPDARANMDMASEEYPAPTYDLFSGNKTTATVLQTGNGNKSLVDQLGTRNNALTWQQGNGNQASVDQQGDNNSAIIVQKGNGNKAAVKQKNSNNSALVTQVGNGGHMQVIQSGNSQNSYTQFGSGMAVRITEH